MDFEKTCKSIYRENVLHIARPIGIMAAVGLGFAGQTEADFEMMTVKVKDD